VITQNKGIKYQVTGNWVTDKVCIEPAYNYCSVQNWQFLLVTSALNTNGYLYSNLASDGVCGMPVKSTVNSAKNIVTKLREAGIITAEVFTMKFPMNPTIAGYLQLGPLSSTTGIQWA